MRFVSLTVCLLSLAHFGLHCTEAAANLTGTVTASDGEPFKGARIFIYTAQPKDGPGILCPSCYPDCTKRATADAEGKFTIENLDPELKFRVLVVGKDHQPKFIKDVDPELGNELNVFLQPVMGDGTPGRQLRGQVQGSDGKPVEGAVVTVRGVTRGEGTRWGGNHDIDPLAVTDEQGNFVIHSDSDFDAAGVDIEARGFAKRVITSLAAGAKVHELRLDEGVTVRGRLLKDGKPVPWADVGLSGADRSSEVYVGNQTVATDNDGKFTFVNVPAKTQFHLYGVMKSLLSRGSLPARNVQTAEPGSTIDLGDLALQPAFSVAGQVLLAEGEPAPPGTRVYLSREDAWDSWQKTVDDDGRFEFQGVPPNETVSLSCRMSGYRLSTKNAGLDPLNPYHLVGRVITNKTDLIIELEPGRNHERLEGDYHTARQEPLRGAEGGPRIGEIKISGTVTDAESGQPLENFTVTEGRASEYQPGVIDWFEARKTAHSNGVFTTHFFKLPKDPAVMIEADGYLPHSSGSIAALETNLVIALRKGAGIEGVVSNPDGTPASGITVFLSDMRESLYAQGSPLTIRDNRGAKKTETDDTGAFKFSPQIDAFSIIVMDDAGFAEVRVDELATNKTVRLQPWARVQGKLMIGSKPGPKESIRLSRAFLPGADHPRTHPALSIYLTTQTDENGAYEFDRVPPFAVHVYHEPKVRDSRMGTVAVSQDVSLVLEPGKTQEIILGGKGRPVIGKMVVEDYEGQINWRSDVYMLELVLPPAEGLPDHNTIFAPIRDKMMKAKTPEERQAIQSEVQKIQEEFAIKQRDFFASDAGRKYHFSRRKYALNFAPDGTFRVEDVPGGKYTLRVDLRESGEGMNRFSSPPIAFTQQEIEVPDSPGGRSDEPYDLGTIALTPRGGLKPGKTMPEIAMKTIEDKPLKISDHKGKFLLLTLWTPWNPNSGSENEPLKETFESFKNNSRFAMVGLSLDPGQSAAFSDYLKTNNLPWTQAYLGDVRQHNIFQQLGLNQLPAIFLVGPDGKLVAKDLRGPAIRQAVESALTSSAETKAADAK